jgi:hypothetical protein
MVVFVLAGINNYSFASDNELLISSGKKILLTWENMLSKGYIDVSQDKGGAWRAGKHLWVPGSGSYDIKKSDSIVLPYILILKFQTRYLGTNGFSPNANGPYYKYFKRKYGFNTAEEALANCSDADFVEQDGMPAKEHVYDIMLSYLYQDESWNIGKGNQDFMIFFGRDLTNDLNRKYFKDLLKVSVKK